MIRVKTTIMGILIGIMSIITALLVVEYYFFRQQTQVMVQMQESYRTYMQAVKHIVDDYTITKERLLLLQEFLSDEKKKEFESLIVSTYKMPFPQGARVFSTDEHAVDVQDSFLVVNRELEYLKESTIAHIKEVEINSLLRRIDFDEWRDYTQQALTPKTKMTRNKLRKARKNSAADRKTSRTTMRSPKHDMSFSWPVDRSKFWLSSFFGPRKKKNGSYGFHHGIDMAALKGTLVTAAAPGKVIEVRYTTGQGSGYGNTIVLAHNGKYKTRYAHLDTILVSVGQKIPRGGPIGTVGNTGFVRSAFGRDPSHLHFELYMFGKQVNPMHFLV